MSEQPRCGTCGGTRHVSVGLHGPFDCIVEFLRQREAAREALDGIAYGHDGSPPFENEVRMRRVARAALAQMPPKPEKGA